MESSGSVQQVEVERARLETVGFAIAMMLSVLLAVCYAISNFRMENETGEVRLEGRINPNEAVAGSLVRLPGVGASLACEVINYRERFRVEDTGAAVFERAEDLQKVRGIGPKKVEQMKEWLRFE